MSDYISRADALAAFEKVEDLYDPEWGNKRYTPDDVEEIINDVPAADVWPLQVGENITENNPVDEFVCSECGIILEDWSKVEIDEDDGERTNHEYAFRYCPNCGKPMK